MRGETIGEFLTKLASRMPAPGGGATAALHAAQAAALLAMVARYSNGPKYAEHADEIAEIAAVADQIRDDAVRLAEADETAFTAVTHAYALPRATDEQKAARKLAIAAALQAACEPPVGVIAAADECIAIAERLEPIGNRNVITDVAAGVEAARAAATTARVNIEVNLGGIADERERAVLLAAARTVDLIAERADKVTATVRAGLIS